MVDLRVGTIMSAEAFPEAIKPDYKLTIEFGGEIGVKKSSAQTTDLHSFEDPVGRQIIGVVNFPGKNKSISAGVVPFAQAIWRGHNGD